MASDELASVARQLLSEAALAIENAGDSSALDAARVLYLGKKGRLPDLLRQIGKLTPEERQSVGAEVNRVRSTLDNLFESRRVALGKQESERALVRDAVDMTMPGHRRRPGKLHLLTRTIDELRSVFAGLGFSYDDYHEIDTEYYNFDALNTPEWHPARDMHDTFYVGDGVLLRTHTSAFQNRVLKKRLPPVRAVTAGRCYRKDEVDASHSPVFHQFDGMAVDVDLSFAELKGTLKRMAVALFGKDAEVRFRPSFFPFTTPSAEMDVSCVVCKGRGCASCSGSGWIEILGCGMMHPNVLRESGVDPSAYRGFAFGIGVDRIAMKRYGISDIRHFYENDVDFLDQA